MSIYSFPCDHSAATTEPLPLAETIFGFGGELDEVLKTFLRKDVNAAHLSLKYRMYYRFRPLIPIFFRQMLQRSRNAKLSVPEKWYVPKAFLHDFRQALLRELQNQSDRQIIHPWPNGNNFALVLTHDIETRKGVELVPRIAELEQKYGFRSAWNFVPYKYVVETSLIESLKQAGHEVGIHGYNHDGNLFNSRSTFTRRAIAINRALKKFESTGFRAPMVHRNLEWLQDLEIDYDASCFDVDPYQAMPGGVGGMWPFIAGRIVELPYTLPQDHTLLITMGHRSIDVWKEKLKLIKRWAGMALLITHPDYLDTPERLDVYRKFLEHLQEQTDMWPTLPASVSCWWRNRQDSKIDLTNVEIIGSCNEAGRITNLSDLFGDALNDPYCQLG